MTCVKIWCFNDAPIEYQKLSQRCGDGCWVIFVPEQFDDWYLIDRILQGECEEYGVNFGTIFISDRN
jgi:hypothetical protein